MPNINDVFNVLEEIGQRWDKEYPRIQVSTRIGLKDIFDRHRTFVELIYENGTFFTCDELTGIKQPMVVSSEHYRWEDILPHLVESLEEIRSQLVRMRLFVEKNRIDNSVLTSLSKFSYNSSL